MTTFNFEENEEAFIDSFLYLMSQKKAKPQQPKINYENLKKTILDLKRINFKTL